MTKNEELRVKEIYGSDYEKTDVPTFIRKRDEAKIRTEEAMVNEHRQEEIKIWDEDRGWITIKKPFFGKMEKSVCCNAPLIGSVQCEICGVDGREFQTE